MMRRKTLICGYLCLICIFAYPTHTVSAMPAYKEMTTTGATMIIAPDDAGFTLNIITDNPLVTLQIHLQYHSQIEGDYRVHLAFTTSTPITYECTIIMCAPVYGDDTTMPSTTKQNIYSSIDDSYTRYGVVWQFIFPVTSYLTHVAITIPLVSFCENDDQCIDSCLWGAKNTTTQYFTKYNVDDVVGLTEYTKQFTYFDMTQSQYWACYIFMPSRYFSDFVIYYFVFLGIVTAFVLFWRLIPTAIDNYNERLNYRHR